MKTLMSIVVPQPRTHVKYIVMMMMITLHYHNSEVMMMIVPPCRPVTVMMERVVDDGASLSRKRSQQCGDDDVGPTMPTGDNGDEECSR